MVSPHRGSFGRRFGGIEELLGREDRDAAEGVQNEEIVVTADEARRPAVDREFQKDVVARIAAGPDGFGDLDVLGVEREQCEKLDAVFKRQEAVKFGSVDHVQKFTERVVRCEKLPAVVGAPVSRGGNR